MPSAWPCCSRKIIASGETLAGVVHLSSLALGASTTRFDADTLCAGGLASLVAVAQAMAADPAFHVPLTIVTRRAQPARSRGWTLAIGQAGMWGLGRVVANEHREFQTKLVDVDELSADAVKRLVDEIVTTSRWDDQVALRAADRLGARLVPLRSQGPPRALEIPRTAREHDVLVRPDGAYLLTGAFGGLGLEVARWLAARGAGRLILVGRRAPGDAAMVAIRAIEAAGTSVDIELANVADLDAMQQVFTAIDAGPHRLRGVIHAAGIVDDGAIAQMRADRFTAVLRPKVDGAWNLHTLTAARELDFFTLFSAGAGLLGAPGQANYAAANTFLDALAWYRLAAGLPALSIDWGPWTDVGMAATVAAGIRTRWAAMGIGAIHPAKGVASLEAALRNGGPQVAVLNMDWGLFAASASGRALPAFLHEVTSVPAGAPSRGTAASSNEEPPGALAALLAAALPADRELLLREQLRGEIGRVLALGPTVVIRPDHGLMELGMDSLMAVDFSNRLARRLGRSMPPTMAFEHPTLGGLTTHVLTLLGWSVGERDSTDIDGRNPVSASIRTGTAASIEEQRRALAGLKERDSRRYPLSATQRRLWFFETPRARHRCAPYFVSADADSTSG